MSIAVDLKQQAGRDIVYSLVKKADVFMSNNELSALERLKMDYDTIRANNPAIVYAFVNAYGTEGPDKDGPGNSCHLGMEALLMAMATGYDYRKYQKVKAVAKRR